MMNESLMSLALSDSFEGRPVNFYRMPDGTVWLSREQIGQALGYSDPGIAIGKVHAHHRERLDAESVVMTSDANGSSYTDPVKEVNRSRVVYSPKGVYEICRWSQQPAADAFFDWVYDVLENLRTTGQYTLGQAGIHQPHVDAATLKHLAATIRATTKALPRTADTWPVIRAIYEAAGIAMPAQLERMSNDASSAAPSNLPDWHHALRQLGSWVQTHADEFVRHRADADRLSRQWVGQWKSADASPHDGGHALCIFRHILENLLSDWGYVPKDVIAGWYQQGWLRRDSDGRHAVPRVQIIAGSEAGQQKRVFYVLSSLGLRIAFGPEVSEK